MAKRGITVAYLAKLSGVSTQTIWEDIRLLWPLATSLQDAEVARVVEG
jgi:predicted DNA-binding transcriptional regulator YafY